MTTDLATRDQDAATAAVALAPGETRHWDLLGRLEQGAAAARAPDGGVRIGRAATAGCFLYGPYVHLPKGHYRLAFRCRGGAPRLAAQPVLGVEIIVLSRFQRQWRDFTADELAAGGAALDFEVTDEHSLEGDNEGRFEFRFFHLGNADLTIAAVTLDRLDAPPPPALASRWRLLGRLRKSWLGRRLADGGVLIRRHQPAGRVLYGGWPYLRLPGGSYRLLLHARAYSPAAAARPVLALELLGRGRWLSRRRAMLLARRPETGGEQLAWRDIAVGELAAGPAALDFTVPTDMAMEAGADAPFDIRLHHFGGVALGIDAIELVRLDAPAAPLAPAWRMLADPNIDGGALRRRGALRLPEGRYVLTVVGDTADGGAAAASLRVELGPGAATLEPRDGTASLEFAVPAPDAEAGDPPRDLTVRPLGGLGFRLSEIAIRRLPEHEAENTPDRPAAPRPRRGGRRKIVIIGNCQSETLRQGFAQSEVLARQFDVKYHFIQLPKNLHEYAARDLESCDVLLRQDIRLWEEFPLREHVRPGADSIVFPLVRFASPWPFDAWNGPGDKEAYDREAPNLTFPYLDGQLGRARKQVPDPEARLRAYRDLELPGVVNYKRLHELEIRRLAGIDRAYDIALGAFVLENFQNRRVFHTTVRPNWEVFTLLLQFVARRLGVREPIALGEGIDASLRNPQVPIHPKVAAELGVKWANERTLYLSHGVEVTWETYVRRYIAHYG